MTEFRDTGHGRAQDGGFRAGSADADEPFLSGDVEDAWLAGGVGEGAASDWREEEDQVVVLPPPKDDSPTWRRRRRTPWWTIFAVALLVVYGLYEAGRRGWLDPGGEAAPARSGEAAAAGVAAERAEAARRFRQVADSLQSAVEGYGLRRSDFDQNRIGCASLRVGYRRVDRHFVSLSLLARERRDRLGDDALDRYEGLMDDVDEVNRHFDGTNCREAG